MQTLEISNYHINCLKEIIRQTDVQSETNSHLVSSTLSCCTSPQDHYTLFPHPTCLVFHNHHSVQLEFGTQTTQQRNQNQTNHDPLGLPASGVLCLEKKSLVLKAGISVYSRKDTARPVELNPGYSQQVTSAKVIQYPGICICCHPRCPSLAGGMLDKPLCGNLFPCESAMDLPGSGSEFFSSCLK